jgi:hypothetical protein
VRNARDQFGSRACATWVGAVMATALLWCSCAQAAETRVLLVRGWFGVFSTGLDTLADELRAKGIKAKVVGHLSWSGAVSEILRDRAAGKTGPIVLVGHSQGANNVIDMAHKLEAANVQVDLLVTLAPSGQDPIPANILRAVNFYQAPGWGAPLTTERGFHGKLSNINMVDDWSISHITMDKSPKVQADILSEIAALTKVGADAVANSRTLPAGGAPPRSADKKVPAPPPAQ